MDNSLSNKVLDRFIDASRLIMAGEFDQASKLSPVTEMECTSEKLSEFSESFALMAVKLEAREFALENTISELKNQVLLRERFSFIFINFLLFLSTYIILFAFIPKQYFHSDIVSIVLEIVFLMSIATYILKFKLSFSGFGLNMGNLKRTLLETVVVAIILVGVLSIVKVFMVKNKIYFQEDRFFEFQCLNWSYASYIITAPLQEFMARGIVQNSIEHVLTGKSKWFWAILLTSLLFGVYHTFFSLKLAMLSIAISIVLGYLFIRHRNIIGISILHFVAGNFAGVLGLWDYIIK